jgi:hypothetical protein
VNKAEEPKDKEVAKAQLALDQAAFLQAGLEETR